MASPLRRSPRRRTAPQPFVAGKETGDYHDGVPAGMLTEPVDHIARAVRTTLERGRASKASTAAAPHSAPLPTWLRVLLTAVLLTVAARWGLRQVPRVKIPDHMLGHPVFYQVRRTPGQSAVRGSARGRSVEES